MVDIQEFPASGSGFDQIIVTLVPNPGGSTSKLGFAQCGLPPFGSRRIQIRTGTPTNQIDAVAAHEMGHILNIEHTGSTDAFGGWGDKDEVMSTCDVDRAAINMTKDDVGALTKQQPERTKNWLVANASFEQSSADPPKGWSPTGAMSTTVVSSAGSPWGNRYLRLSPDAPSDKLRQKMNVTGAGPSGGTGMAEIDARVSYRKSSAITTTGGFVMSIWVRSVEYPPKPSNCQGTYWPSADYENDRSAVGPWTRVRVETVTVNNSSSFFTRYETDWGDWDAIDQFADAFDLQVRLRNTLLDSSQESVSLDIDGLTLREET
ncbi:MAG: hypothetical protein HKN91_00475 [Acidimicrobiia bacterium]|nr:hypothetical protein [Acidimicrobiia bacterium]